MFRLYEAYEKSPLLRLRTNDESKEACFALLNRSTWNILRATFYVVAPDTHVDFVVHFGITLACAYCIFGNWEHIVEFERFTFV